MTRRYSTYWYGGMPRVLRQEDSPAVRGTRYWTRRIVLASDQCFSRP